MSLQVVAGLLNGFSLLQLQLLCHQWIRDIRKKDAANFFVPGNPEQVKRIDWYAGKKNE